MSSWRSWMSVRLSFRLGHRRFLLRFPPAAQLPEGNRWALVLAIAILMPVGYVLSAVPTIKALRKSGLYTPSVEACAMLVYAPLVVLDQQSPVCRAFFEAEDRLLSSVVGE